MGRATSGGVKARVALLAQCAEGIVTMLMHRQDQGRPYARRCAAGAALKGKMGRSYSSRALQCPMPAPCQLTAFVFSTWNILACGSKL